MSTPPLPSPDHFDAYLHDLLTADEASAVERNVAASDEWRAALDAAKRRRAALIAALPRVEPSAALVEDTVRRVRGYDRARWRGKARTLGFMFGPLAAAAGVLFALQIGVSRTEATPANLEVIGQNRLLADSTAALRVRLTNGQTRAPLTGWRVNATLVGQDNVPVAAPASQTDGQGNAVIPIWMSDKMAAGNYTLKVRADNGSQPEELSALVTIRRESKLMLSTDKPVYQPGQTIRVRSLTLRKPSFKPLADTPAVFTINDPKGNTVFKHTATTSKFGIAATDCPLATEIIEGAYTIHCKVGDTSSSATVEVQKYVLPKFKIGIDLDQTFYQPGQTAKGKVQANYFHGKPVAGGTVDIEVRANEPNGAVLAKFGRKTADDGSAAFDFLLPQTLAGRPQEGGDAKFLLTVTLTDTAGQKQARTVTRAVTAEAVKIEVIPENSTLVPGTVNKVYVYAGTADGRPAAKCELTITAAGQTMKSTTNDLGVATFDLPPTADIPARVVAEAKDAQGRTGRREVVLSQAAYGDFLLRMDKAVVSGGDSLSMVVIGAGIEPVFLDVLKDGQTVRTEVFDMRESSPAARGGSLVLDIPPDWAGTVELCAYRFLPSGLPLRKLRTLYVRPASQLRLNATLDKPEYRPGEMAKLTFALTDDKGQPAPGALSVAAVDEAVFAVLESMPGMEKTFYLLEQELLKPVYAIYPWAPDGPGGPDRQEFEQALFSRTVRTLTPPPQPVEVTRMRMVNGVPITEIVQMVDAPGSPHTLRLETYTGKVQAAAVAKALGLERVMAGWKWLAIVAGAALYFALWLTWGERLSGRIVLGTLTGLVVLAGAFIWYAMNAPNSRSGQIWANMGMTKDGPDSMMPTAMAPPMRAMEGAMPKGEDPAEAVDAVRVREKFPETLIWLPQLVTDDQGRATLDVELADSITTWRLSASAVTGDGRLGALQSGVKVFQPFFVDLNVPVALTRGDEVGVPVVVSNYLPRPQTVELTLADTPWAERQGDAAQKVELQPNEVKAVTYRLKVKQVGSHTLQITARGEGVSDAVKRPIEVVPDGKRVEQVVSGTLQEPANMTVSVPNDAIEGSPKLFVKLYPSSFSQLVEGLDSIFQMPYGCFEQTSSTTYPNVLALDYLKKSGKASPQVEAKARQYVHLGYQRLLTFEVPGGGFDWYGRPPADVALTAYGLMEFTDMARVHDVDPALIQRTRNWLIRQRRPDGSWSGGRFNQGAGDATLRTTAYVAWAVFHDPVADIDPTPTVNFLLRHRPESFTDANLLALVSNALLHINAKHADVPAYLARLDALKKTTPDSKQAWWELGEGARTQFYAAGTSANVETTALAAMAFLHAGDRPGTVRQALTWLVAQKDGRGTWHSTQATVLALKALLAGTGKPLGGDGERAFEVTMEGQPAKSVTIPADQAEVMTQLDLSGTLAVGGTKRLMVTELTKSAAGFQVAFRYHVPTGDVKPQADEPLAIELKYDREALSLGETVTATATVTNRMGQAAPMVMVDLPIPAGFAVDVANFEKLVRERKIARYQTTPRQVLVYLRELAPGAPLTIEYVLRPTMPVTLTVPAARVYEYYTPEREGRSAVGQLTVAGR